MPSSNATTATGTAKSGQHTVGYAASEIAGVVTINAIGAVPNLNMVAQLVQLPLMIWPPRGIARLRQLSGSAAPSSNDRY